MRKIVISNLSNGVMLIRWNDIVVKNHDCANNEGINNTLQVTYRLNRGTDKTRNNSNESKRY